MFFYDTMAGIEGRKNGMSAFLNSLAKSFSQIVVSGSPILNEAFAQVSIKRGSSLPMSTFYTVTRADDSGRLDTGITHRSPSAFLFDGASAPV